MHTDPDSPERTIPLFMADPDHMMMLADMNQCLSVVALHRQHSYTYYRR
jgi:hypothetical protein